MDHRSDTLQVRRSKGYYFAIGISVAAGLILRWWNLGGESLWFDEAYTAWAARQPIAQLIDVVRVDNSPPLYYLFMHFWTRVCGESEFALRAPSALAGSAALLLMVPLARRVLNNAAAEIAAVMLSAVTFLLIRYAHEARCYEMLALLCVSAVRSQTFHTWEDSVALKSVLLSKVDFTSDQ